MTGPMDSAPVIFAVDDASTLGGVQRVVYELIDGLADRGVASGLLTLARAQQPSALRSRYPAPSLTLQPRPLALRYPPLTGWRRTKLRLTGSGAELRAFDDGVRRLRPLVEGSAAIFVAMQLGVAAHLVRAGVPADRLIMQYHDSFDAASRWDLAPLRSVARAAGTMLCLTADDAARFRAAGIPGMAYQPNPVDVDRLSAPEGAFAREPVIVAAGRFEEQKSYDLLLDAWSRIGVDHPDWRLEIYGDGSQRARLQDRARRIDRARILPFTDDIQRRFHTAGLHALSSRHEGMPMVLTEAMCARLPTVATDCSAGVRDLVRPDHTGLLVPIGDAAALARGLDRLIRDDALRARLGDGAHRHIRRYDISRVIDQWAARLRRPATATPTATPTPVRRSVPGA